MKKPRFWVVVLGEPVRSPVRIASPMGLSSAAKPSRGMSRTVRQHQRQAVEEVPLAKGAQEPPALYGLRHLDLLIRWSLSRTVNGRVVCVGTAAGLLVKEPGNPCEGLPPLL
jgi:hypothetical protein